MKTSGARLPGAKRSSAEVYALFTAPSPIMKTFCKDSFHDTSVHTKLYFPYKNAIHVALSKTNLKTLNITYQGTDCDGTTALTDYYGNQK